MAVSRALRLTTFLLATLVAGTTFAATPALVMDADTGKVIHAERATDPWFPASVTKLMTVYVALDMVRSGRASMEQLLTVSEEAYALPPSKMAFKPGTQIRLDNALKIIMVKSANDIASTIAENLGGSVDGFANLMNDAARRFSMRESRFVNPHGLPDDRQQTSARDMALLARALLREFPQHNDLFQIGAIQFGRRVMRNHNGLIGRYPGADGMKTGFICASGFNVVATAKRNGRRLITVVLGSSSANERTLKAAELFDYGFENVSSLASVFRPTAEALPASAIVTPPNMRPVICERRGPMPGEDDSGATAMDSENSGLGSNVLAFAGGYVPPTNRTVLGPRGPVQPIRVWVGAAPPDEAQLAAQAAEEEAAEEARKAAKAAKSKTKTAARKPAVESKAMKEFIENDPKPIIADSKTKAAEKKEPARASVSLKPVTDAAEKPKPAAKPATAAKPADDKPKLEAKPKPAAPKVEADAKPKPAAPAPKVEAKAEAKPKPAAKPEAAKPLNITPQTAKPAPKPQASAADAKPRS